MTGNRKSARIQLDRLDEALVDDILNASDEEILAEAGEDYGNAEAAVAHMRGLIGNVLAETGKAKMAAARAALRGRARAPSNIVCLSVQQKQAIFNRLIEDDPQLREKLTRAARKEDQLSERDLDSMLEALRELGVIDDEGNAG